MTLLWESHEYMTWSPSVAICRDWRNLAHWTLAHWWSSCEGIRPWVKGTWHPHRCVSVHLLLLIILLQLSDFLPPASKIFQIHCIELWEPLFWMLWLLDSWFSFQKCGLGLYKTGKCCRILGESAVFSMQVGLFEDLIPTQDVAMVYCNCFLSDATNRFDVFMGILVWLD